MGSFCSVKGRVQGERGGKEQEWRGRRGDVDSDAKLLPRRLNRWLIGGGGVEPSLSVPEPLA